MFAMPLGRRQALFALVFSILLLLGGLVLLRNQGLLVLTKPASAEPAAEADMPNALERHALEAIAPSGPTQPQPESTSQGTQGRAFAMLSLFVRISGGGGLNAHETDANGNPVLGDTYVLSVPFAFALGDIPI